MKKFAVIFALSISALAQQAPPSQAPSSVGPTVELTIDQKVELYRERVLIDQLFESFSKLSQDLEKAAKALPEYKALNESMAKKDIMINEIKEKGKQFVEEDKRRQGVTAPLWYDWKTNSVVDHDPDAPQNAAPSAKK